MYSKGEFIGGGGFGRVFYCKGLDGIQYAMKELNLDAYIRDQKLCDNIKRRFSLEATSQAEIDHPNVIKVVHQALDEEPPYFVMELADSTFESIIQNYVNDSSQFGLIKTALFNILSGLDAIHEIGIWHRDLKPQNILFIEPDRFALSDFGLIAVRDTGATTLTLTGTTAGSRDYSPPEFMKDFKKADASSDIYSFGAILHDIFVRKLRVPYSELRDGTNKIGVVIAKCTKSKQYSRYRNIEELRSDLFDAISEMEIIGESSHPDINLDIFSFSEINENDCESITDLIDTSSPEQLAEIYLKFSIEFIEMAYKASEPAANYMAEQYALYVMKGSFDFNYCDVIADRLVHCYTKGAIATKSLCLLALLELGTSHNRWYVERRFLANADKTCNVNVIRRFILDSKTCHIDLDYRLRIVLRSISAQKEQLHPKIAELIP